MELSGLLLDTHALIWALGKPERLGFNAQRLILDPNRQLVVSAVSAWEISNKHRIGKLPGVEGLIDEFEPALSRLGAQSLDISPRHALYGGGMKWEHRDPFDRMLAAQAMIEGFTLVTRDPVFSALTDLETVW